MVGFKAAIFDLDGTILDSTGMWKRLAEEYVLSRGKTPREGLSERVWELSTSEAAKLLKEEYSLCETADEIARELIAMTEEFYRERALLKSGAEELLRGLSERGVRLALATASDLELARAALERTGVMGYFSAFFSTAEYGEKTSPDIFLAAAKALGAKPRDTAVFEDSFIAAKTARSAGFFVCAVKDDAEPRWEEMKKIADAIF